MTLATRDRFDSAPPQTCRASASGERRSAERPKRSRVSDARPRRFLGDRTHRQPLAAVVRLRGRVEADRQQPALPRVELGDEGHVHLSAKVTGLAQILQVGPRF